MLHRWLLLIILVFVTVQGLASTPTFPTALADHYPEVGVPVRMRLPAAQVAPGEVPVYSVKGLPSGLSFDSATRIVSGIPTKARATEVTYTAKTTSGNVSSTATFAVTASDPGDVTALGAGELHPSNAQILQPIDSSLGQPFSVMAGVPFSLVAIADGGKYPTWRIYDSNGTEVNSISGFSTTTSIGLVDTYTVVFSVAPSVNYAGSSAQITVEVTGTSQLFPVINEFRTEPAGIVSIPNGQLLRLYWSVSNSTTKTLVRTVNGVTTYLDVTSLPHDYQEIPAATTSYQLQAVNGQGMVSSGIVTVEVVVPPTIPTGPQNVSVTEGQTATFSATANGTAPLGYQWRKNGVVIPGATSSSYTTSATTLADNGALFSVVVSNAAGSVTSANATLTVAAALPMITSQPVGAAVTEGQPATFSVTANGSAPLGYQWRKNGTAISGATASAYTTPATTLTDNGALFSVVVSNTAGSVTSANATLSVTGATTPPTITTQPASLNKTVGQPAGFTVAATGSAPLSYQWSKNASPIVGATGSSYNLASVQTSDAGTYTVQVSNCYGSITSQGAVLTVTSGATAPTLTAQPVSTSVTLGQAATFSVTATGTAPLGYQWRKNGASLPGATAATYTTQATVLADNGALFSVVVTNTAGSVTSVNAILTVTSAVVPPSITTQPASLTVAMGQPASFTVAASGSAPLSYQWSKNASAIAGATASSYNLASVLAMDGGTYTVTVTNSAGGATSNGATLTVTGADPVISLGLSFATLNPGQSTTLSWAVANASSVTLQEGAGAPASVAATGSKLLSPAVPTTYIVAATGNGKTVQKAVSVTVLGVMGWKRDIVYLGGREVAEVAPEGVTSHLTDHLGTPRIRVHPDGSVIEQKFAPFGESLTDPTMMSKFVKGFTNHEQTDPSGLIYMQARFYAPMYHRFLSPDPALDQHFQETQSWNIYSYVQNNPVMNFDPNGMELKSSIEDSKIILPMLNKLAIGGKVAYDARTTSYSISGAGGSKGFELINRIINNQNTTSVAIGDGNTENAVGESNSRVNVTGRGLILPVGENGQQPEAIMNFGTPANIKMEEAPAEIVLGHELIHAEHRMNGTQDWTPENRQETKNTKEQGQDGRGNGREEYRTVGLPGRGKTYNKPGDITENDLRREQKNKPRVSYESKRMP